VPGEEKRKKAKKAVWKINYNNIVDIVWIGIFFYQMTGDIAVVMAGIFGALLLVLVLLSLGLTVSKEGAGGNWLPPKANAAKRSFEIYALGYSVVWIGVFAVVVAQKHYEYFEEVRSCFQFLCVCKIYSMVSCR
jgi:hypothetical protein